MDKKEYKISITIEKGARQLLNVITSIVISIILIVIVRCIIDSDFKIKDITPAVESISNSIILIVPVVSSILNMIINFKKHYKQNE